MSADKFELASSPTPGILIAGDQCSRGITGRFDGKISGSQKSIMDYDGVKMVTSNSDVKGSNNYWRFR